jgi:hypothetical protein
MVLFNLSAELGFNFDFLSKGLAEANVSAFQKSSKSDC